TLAMRVRVEGRRSLRELVGEVRRKALEGYRHQEVPFEKVVEELSPQRTLNTTPIFQVMFALQNNSPHEPAVSKLSMYQERLEPGHVRFDLEVHAWEQDGEIGFYWAYNKDVFEGWYMEQMAGNYIQVLNIIAADDQYERLV
ncbi:MAG: non-ribosomal peptide synthetase, partial [Acidobacteriia bacterium]|nr:non-ribosomal peptide synthetase [Terriglobia bacterium]